MSTKKLLLICVVACFIAHPGLSQDKWDLKKCVEYALANNISVKQSDIDARVANLTFTQSKASRFGQVSFNTSLGLNLGRSVDPTTNLFSNTQSLYQGFSLQGGVNLFNWNSLRRAIEANDFSYQAALVNTEKIRNDITLNVAAAYLQALLAREQVDVSKTKLDLTKAQLDNTRKLVDAGSLPELNAAELETQFATDTASVISAVATYQQNVLTLKATLAMDAAAPFELDTPAVESIPVEPIAELQPDIVYATAEKAFPQQRLNELRISAAQKTVGAYKGQLYPTLSAFLSLGNNFANDLQKQIITPGVDAQTALYTKDGTNQLFVYQPTFTSSHTAQPFGDVWNGYWSQLDNNFRQSVGVQLNVPIFNGNTARANYQKAKLNVKTAELVKESDLLTLKQNIYQAYYNALSYREKYEANKKAVVTAERSFDLSTKRYNIGLLNTIDYLTNQNNLFTARINVLAAQYNYVFTMKVLEFYKGLGIKL